MLLPVGASPASDLVFVHEFPLSSLTKHADSSVKRGHERFNDAWPFPAPSNIRRHGRIAGLAGPRIQKHTVSHSVACTCRDDLTRIIDLYDIVQPTQPAGSRSLLRSFIYGRQSR
jgi:hypothetical protein